MSNQIRKAVADEAGKLIARMMSCEQSLANLKHALANLDPKAEGYTLDLDDLTKARNAEQKQLEQLKMRLNVLEVGELNKSLIRVISQTKTRAEIVIQGTEPDGSKTSLTRHLRRENGKWTGWSLFGLKTREFILEVGSDFAEAAA